MDKFKKVKAIGNIIGFNIDASGNETYNVQFPDMTIAELESYQFEEADAYHTNDRPRYLRNVLARLRELPEHDREAWLKGIMGEFKKDFSHAKWCEGYEQGKFDGAVEAEKSNKVVIPQFVAEWIETCKKIGDFYVSLGFALSPAIWKENNLSDECVGWLFEADNQDIFARAWLDDYDVEQEKRYEVSIKASGQYLARTKLKEIKFMYNGACSHLTRKELEDAGLGWVFDCEGVEVQEVE
nr:DUF1642 domain-containing protein [Streptococcus constellatus]